VDVHLVADVPDDTVAGGIEEAMEDDREFDNAEVAGEVTAAADALDRIDERLADLAAKLVDFGSGEAAKVGRLVYTVEDRGHARSS
jgi:hypothetical protein